MTGRPNAPTVAVTVDGIATAVPRDTTVAAALAALGRLDLRTSRPSGVRRGVFCGMGSCYDCVTRVDGTSRRACLVVVTDGMCVDTGREVSA